MATNTLANYSRASKYVLVCFVESSLSFNIIPHYLFSTVCRNVRRKAKPTATSKANSSKTSWLGASASTTFIKTAPMNTLSWKRKSNRPRRSMRTKSDNSTIKTSMKYLTKIQRTGSSSNLTRMRSCTMPSLVSILPRKSKERLSWDSRSASFPTPRRGLCFKLISRLI